MDNATLPPEPQQQLSAAAAESRRALQGSVSSCRPGEEATKVQLYLMSLCPALNNALSLCS